MEIPLKVAQNSNISVRKLGSNMHLNMRHQASVSARPRHCGYPVLHPEKAPSKKENGRI